MPDDPNEPQATRNLPSWLRYLLLAVLFLLAAVAFYFTNEQLFEQFGL